VRLTADTGPQGLQRSLQASQAVFQLGTGYVSSLVRGGTPDPPEVLLRKLFEKLGATYIKLGQFIASSPSLFPAKYVMEFQKCLDQTVPVPYDQIKAVIDVELSQPADQVRLAAALTLAQTPSHMCLTLDGATAHAPLATRACRVQAITKGSVSPPNLRSGMQVFSFIDPVPIASASVAQVHGAELRGSGQRVVLKVLKPGVEGVLRSDLNFIFLAVQFLQALNPDLERTSIKGIVEDIRVSMLDEVNFVKEAQHIAQFSQYLDAMGMGGVATCPFVYKQHSSERLLVMERIDGVPLTDLAVRRCAPARATPQARRTVLVHSKRGPHVRSHSCSDPARCPARWHPSGSMAVEASKASIIVSFSGLFSRLS
jgi:aarF domain-containing kinase